MACRDRGFWGLGFKVLTVMVLVWNELQLGKHPPLPAGPSGCVGLKTTPAPPGCICTYLRIRRGGNTPNRHVDTKPNLHC